MEGRTRHGCIPIVISVMSPHKYAQGWENVNLTRFFELVHVVLHFNVSASNSYREHIPTAKISNLYKKTLVQGQ